MEIYGANIRGAFSLFGDAFYNAEIDNGNGGLGKTITWSLGNKQKITLNNSPCVLVFNNPGGCTTLSLRVIQDAGGNRLITWPGGIKWAAASAPTLTVAGNAIDIVAFYFDGAVYHGIASLNFA